MSIPPASPLVCSAASFVADPAFADTVDQGYDRPDIHSPTTGPNRYTLHVPTEVTRLSLGKESERWNTDEGITAYTNSHIHFEVKAHDRTVMSLGGPATTSTLKGLGDAAPVTTHGYAMVTEELAWQEAMEQHYFISQTGDISLRTPKAGKRAVIQSDTGAVDLNGGQQVNLSGGGVAIGAASEAELELEDVHYGAEAEGKRPHSKAAGGSRIGVAVLAGIAALHDVIANTIRTKYKEGNFAPLPHTPLEKGKRIISAGLFALAANKVKTLVTAKGAPASCVKIDAAAKVTAVAGNNLGFYGLMGASLGSTLYSTVAGGISASLSAVGFAGVGGSFVSLKGLRKVEIASDWGEVFVGAETEIKMNAERNLLIAAEKIAHVASPGDEGHALFGGGEKTWMGTAAGGGWGVLLGDECFSLGRATAPKELETTKVRPLPAIRINDDVIEIQGGHKATLTLNSGNCTLVSPKISFEATSGPVTVNGAKILLK